MKILALSERRGIAGGIESYMAAIDRAFALAGVEHRILTRDDLHWSDEHDPPSPDAAERLRSYAYDYRPDVIALHSVLDSEVIRAARASARVVAYHLHDHRLFCPNGNRVFPQGGKRCREAMGGACLFHALVHGCAYGPRPRTATLLERRRATAKAAMEADATVVLSTFMARTAKANGVPPASIACIEPPLDESFFETPPRAPATRRILFSGRVEPEKGLHSLVRALGRIEPTRRPPLAVAGDGTDVARCVDLARAERCELVILGKLDRTALIDEIDASRLLAMPSLWDEPFGLAGIEAFARARPVAAYAVGAIPDWIGEGGIAVAPGDEHALARAIETIVDADRWQAFSSAAAERARHYRMAAHVRALLDIYGNAAP